MFHFSSVKYDLKIKGTINRNTSTTKKEIDPSTIVYSNASLTCKIDKLNGLKIYRKIKTKNPTHTAVLSLYVLEKLK